MKLARLPARLGVGAALAAITAFPFGAYADCPPGTSGSGSSMSPQTQQDQAYATAGENGAGLPVTRNGTITPGSTLGIGNDRDTASNKPQGAAADRDPKTAQTQPGNNQTGNNMQVAKGPSNTSCN